MCSPKHLENKFWRLRYKIMQKWTSKGLIKTFLTYFFTNFLQNIWNRPYPDVKIIPHLDTFIRFSRVLLALDLSGSLDFSSEDLCLYAKLSIPFFNKCNFFQTLRSRKLKVNLTINQWFEKLFFNSIATFSSIFFLCLYFWCYVAMNKK